MVLSWLSFQSVEPSTRLSMAENKNPLARRYQIRDLLGMGKEPITRHHVAQELMSLEKIYACAYLHQESRTSKEFQLKLKGKDNTQYITYHSEKLQVSGICNLQAKIVRALGSISFVKGFKYRGPNFEGIRRDSRGFRH